MKGQVIQVGGGIYTVQIGEDRVEATLRGKVKFSGLDDDRVVIGDRVEVDGAEAGAYTIEAVEPRATWLVRRTLGGRRFKIVAANLDQLVVLASLRDPSPSPSVIDRMLVMGESGGMNCILVLTKVDLLEDAQEAAILAVEYRTAGYEVHPTSVVSGQGLDPVRALLSSGSSALVGPSGVGKSSLINAIEPSVRLLTQEVGQRSRSGKHTTVSSRLFSLALGGRVADTPGFSDVGLGDVATENLGRCFPEFRPFLASCHFRDCSHLREPGCAVLAALADGQIAQRRHDSYAEILLEIT